MICTSLGSLSVASVIWDSAAWSYTWRRLHACPAIWGLHFCLYLLEHRLGEVLDSTEVDNIDSPAEVAGDLTSAYSHWKSLSWKVRLSPFSVIPLTRFLLIPEPDSKLFSWLKAVNSPHASLILLFFHFLSLLFILVFCLIFSLSICTSICHIL